MIKIYKRKYTQFGLVAILLSSVNLAQAIETGECSYKDKSNSVSWVAHDKSKLPTGMDSVINIFTDDPFLSRMFVNKIIISCNKRKSNCFITQMYSEKNGLPKSSLIYKSTDTNEKENWEYNKFDITTVDDETRQTTIITKKLKCSRIDHQLLWKNKKELDDSIKEFNKNQIEVEIVGDYLPNPIKDVP